MDTNFELFEEGQAHPLIMAASRELEPLLSFPECFVDFVF
jgi:hypothetical protein